MKLQRKKIDYWFWRAGGISGSLGNGSERYEISFSEMKCSKSFSGDGCITLWIYLKNIELCMLCG